mmetsp:Transcript_13740/g.39589  ORF Transcript_13740/g.39589 Transcript_13740/m.39589 type:complete len:329 (-) Transcript_13740:1394-2380(-)
METMVSSPVRPSPLSAHETDTPSSAYYPSSIRSSDCLRPFPSRRHSAPLRRFLATALLLGPLPFDLCQQGLLLPGRSRRLHGNRREELWLRPGRGRLVGCRGAGWDRGWGGLLLGTERFVASGLHELASCSDGCGLVGLVEQQGRRVDMRLLVETGVQIPCVSESPPCDELFGQALYVRHLREHRQHHLGVERRLRTHLRLNLTQSILRLLFPHFVESVGFDVCKFPRCDGQLVPDVLGRVHTAIGAGDAQTHVHHSVFHVGERRLRHEVLHHVQEAPLLRQVLLRPAGVVGVQVECFVEPFRGSVVRLELDVLHHVTHLPRLGPHFG